MCTAYQQIKKLDNANQLNDFAEQLLRLKAKRRSRPEMPLLLPNLVVKTIPGCGTGQHIRLLAQLLEEEGLLLFNGEEKVFEWIITQEDVSFDPLLGRVQAAGGIYGSFCGVVVVELSAALQNPWPASFLRLRDYVAAQQGRIMFVFLVPINTASDLIQQLLVDLSCRTPLAVIDIPWLSDDCAVSYITDELKKRGLSVNKDVPQLIGNTLRQITSHPNFRGYHTLQSLVDEFTWYVASRKRKDLHINPKDANGLLKTYLDAFRRRTPWR